MELKQVERFKEVIEKWVKKGDSMAVAAGNMEAFSIEAVAELLDLMFEERGRLITNLTECKSRSDTAYMNAIKEAARRSGILGGGF